MPPIRSVSCGFHFTICVGCDSSVWAFGHNGARQLGVGSTRNALSPTKIDIRACQVACGSGHTMIVDPEGNLFVCGDGNHGQLGKGDTSFCSTFTWVKGIPRVKSVHCGNYFTLLVDENQCLWSTGDNSNGCLGLGDYQNRHSFVQVPDLCVDQLACGNQHVMSIDKDSTLWGWGDNQFGQLTRAASTRPVMLRQDAATVSTGSWNTILRNTNDQVFVSGHNGYGQLSIGHTSHLPTWTLNPNISPAFLPEASQRLDVQSREGPDGERNVSMLTHTTRIVIFHQLTLKYIFPSCTSIDLFLLEVIMGISLFLTRYGNN